MRTTIACILLAACGCGGEAFTLADLPIAPVDAASDSAGGDSAPGDGGSEGGNSPDAAGSDASVADGADAACGVEFTCNGGPYWAPASVCSHNNGSVTPLSAGPCGTCALYSCSCLLGEYPTAKNCTESMGAISIYF